MIKEQEFIQSLKRIMNLSNVKHLYIALNYAGEMPSILLKISQLSSLIIHPSSLELMLSDKELCKYLNKMIKKLDIDRYSYIIKVKCLLK